jgi:hypothetical protein
VISTGYFRRHANQLVQVGTEIASKQDISVAYDSFGQSVIFVCLGEHQFRNVTRCVSSFDDYIFSDPVGILVNFPAWLAIGLCNLKVTCKYEV